MAASSSEPSKKPISITLTNITEAVIGYMSLGPNTYHVSLIIKFDSTHSVFTTILVKVFKENVIKFQLKDLLETMIFDSRIQKTKIAEIVEALKKAGLVPPERTEYSYFDHSEIQKILTTIKKDGLWDYSLLLSSNILFTIEERLNAKSNMVHYQDLKNNLKYQESKAKDLATAILTHAPYVDNVNNCFKIDDYPEFKRLKEALDMIFPPPKTPAKKRQRR